MSTNFDQISPSFRQRLEGFLGELDREYPDIQIVNRDFDFVFQQGDYENILEIVRKNPDLEALYVVNPGDYSICEKISELDKDNHKRHYPETEKSDGQGNHCGNNRAAAGKTGSAAAADSV